MADSLDKVKEIQELKTRFYDFRISYILQRQNETTDFLVRTILSFYRILCFVGYFTQT